MLLVVLCASCDYLGAMGDSSSTSSMSFSHHAPAQRITSALLNGRLIYLTNTRPDLTFAVSVVSQFMHAPRTSHLDAVDRKSVV